MSVVKATPGELLATADAASDHLNWKKEKGFFILSACSVGLISCILIQPGTWVAMQEEVKARRKYKARINLGRPPPLAKCLCCKGMPSEAHSFCSRGKKTSAVSLFLPPEFPLQQDCIRMKKCNVMQHARTLMRTPHTHNFQLKTSLLN